MIRLEAYVDSSNKLKISVFNNSQYESKILEGREVQELIKQLYTEKILDILKENNVKAAFFITGHYLNTASDLVERMISEGHIVGNHS